MTTVDRWGRLYIRGGAKSPVSRGAAAGELARPGPDRGRPSPSGQQRSPLSSPSGRPSNGPTPAAAAAWSPPCWLACPACSRRPTPPRCPIDTVIRSDGPGWPPFPSSAPNNPTPRHKPHAAILCGFHPRVPYHAESCVATKRIRACLEEAPGGRARDRKSQHRPANVDR